MSEMPTPLRSDTPDLSPSRGPEERLEHFCQATLDLLRLGSGDGSVVAFVAPALAHALAEGSRDVIDRLRGELPGWETAASHLRHLANSSVLGFGQEATKFLGRLDQARSQAERVVEALEMLNDGRGQPRTVNEELPAAPHRVEFAVTETHARVPLAKEQALALFAQAEACRRARQFVEAEALYDDALRHDPTLRPAYLQRGRSRAFQGQAEEAIDDLSEAIRLYPDDAVAYWWRGDALALRDRLEEAIEDYSRALRLRPELFLARYNRASSLRQLGDTTRSLLEFDALIELQPTDAPLYLNRGLIHLGRGRVRRALVDFRTALRYMPDSEEARQGVRDAKDLLRTRRAQRQRPVVADRAISSRLKPTNADAPPLKPAVARRLASEPAAPTASIPLGPEPSVADRPRTASADPVGPPDAASRASAKAAAMLESSLSLDCPACGQSSSVRWDKLQRGKLFGCPQCNTRLTAREDGKLVEVVKDGAGRWVERGRKEPWGRARRSWLVAGVGAVALALGALLWAPKAWQQRSDAETELPRDLEPRVKVFAKAWLAGDYARMRRLTDPTQDKVLFVWHRKNMPAAWGVAGDARVEVDVLPSQPPMASLRVRFVAAQSDSTRPPVQIYLSWEERGGVWNFKPALHLRPRRANGA